MNDCIKIIGIDPGTAHVGVATIEYRFDGKIQFLSCDVFHPREINTLLFSRAKAQGVHFAGIEVPEARNGAGGIKYVSPTAVVGGFAGGLCKAMGIEPLFLFPRHWRKIVVGKGAAKDKDIKEALERYIPSMPRTNAHVRDAIGVAMVAGRRFLFGEDVGNGLELVA